MPTLIHKIPKYRHHPGSGQAVVTLGGKDVYLGPYQSKASHQAYASNIENNDGTDSYRIVALIDVTERERSQREALERKLRDRDILLREIQHRVKNNLQIIVSLMNLQKRMEASLTLQICPNL